MKLAKGKVSFLIKLAAFQASGGAERWTPNPEPFNLEPWTFEPGTRNPRVKLHAAGTVNILNVEHRTSNIERRILMTLRFIDL